MEYRISATDLARKLGDVLGRIRYRGDSFVIERNGAAVARIIPLHGARRVSLREALMGLIEAGPPDSDFADVLEELGTEDRPPKDPWDS